MIKYKLRKFEHLGAKAPLKEFRILTPALRLGLMKLVLNGL